MPAGDDRSGFYREEAEGCRRLARLIALPEVAAALLALAADFDRWAGPEGRGKNERIASPLPDGKREG